MLSQPILNGNLIIEPWMIDLDPSRIKVRKIDGYIDCTNLALTQLPAWFQSIEEVTKSFYCHSNQLTSLEGSPQTVGWSFCCDNNMLTSLEGGPQTVGWSFDCSNNQLTSLEGLPKEIGRDLWCYSNAKQFIEADIPSDTKIGGEIKFKP